MIVSRLSAAAFSILAAFLFSGFMGGDAGRLEVRVVDADTGKTIPARLVLRDSSGAYPGDRMACSASRWPNLEAHGIFIRGPQAFDVAAGKTEVTAAHGLEYEAESRTVDVEPGKAVSVEIRLRRVVNMRLAGWAAGDIHVHMIHGENQRQTGYEDVAATCDANGLDFLYVCQEWIGAGKLDLKGYETECDRVSSDSFRMFIGAERPQDLLGHQALIGVPNPFVVSEDPPYYQAAAQVHAQGGASVYVHPVRYYPGKQYEGKWLDFPGNNLARELVYDAFCGPSFDGISVLSDEPASPEAFGLWFSLLNRGLFVPAFADSDACFDRPTFGIKAPGLWNTYFYIGPNGKIDHRNLSEAVRKGRTMATTGPLLQFTIGGEISGSTLPPDGNPKTVKINAWLPQHAFTLEKREARSGRAAGIGRIELIRNGEVVKWWEPHAPRAEVEHAVTESSDCWYVVRVFGEDARWQVGAASPIYFARRPVGKRAPTEAAIHGRIYDFQSGKERSGAVEIRRAGRILKRFRARGEFEAKMPLDAEIAVTAEGFRPVRHELLKDYGPIHRFLWYLTSADLAKPSTFERFEGLVRDIRLDFPLGYRMPGSYVASDLDQPTELGSARVAGGPARASGGTAAVGAVLMDAEQIAPGDTLHLAAIFREEGDVGKLGPLVVEARAYDPSRPSAFEELKKFAEFEKPWETAVDLGNGYRLVAGSLKVAEWAEPGPTGGIDISVRARQGNGDAAFLGLQIPLGPTRRALSISTSWPTMPISWPDRNYGIGPFRLCSRLGRAGQPKSDYRKLQITLRAGSRTLELNPERDARGCAQSGDAFYTDQFLDQILNEESRHIGGQPPR